MSNISNLYYEMRVKHALRQQFQIEYNGVLADTLFFIDQTPFILAFGIIGTTDYFELQMQTGFNIAVPFSDEVYHEIIKAFNIKYDPTHTFRPTDFLKAINKKMPQHLTGTKPATPPSIAKYRRNDITEADKIYFCGFINERKFGKATSSKNLKKTLILMGRSISALFKRRYQYKVDRSGRCRSL